MNTNFERHQIKILRDRIKETPQFIIVVAGPRQVGKTTMVNQALTNLPNATFVAMDRPLTMSIPNIGDDFSKTQVTLARPPDNTKVTSELLIKHWNDARAKAKNLKDKNECYILAIDEIQKVLNWSNVVKGLWDEDRQNNIPLHIILLGSSPWLMRKGTNESLAGRCEFIQLSHWSYTEMQEVFDLSLDEFIYFGGYPGSMKRDLISDEDRWRKYVRDSLINPNIKNDIGDILQEVRVDKPELLKNLFELGCAYSSQITSFTKLQGQLPDAGNTTTLTNYLNLLSQAGLLTGIQKYANREHRRRASLPKINVHNTALISALSDYSFSEAKNDRAYWGRLVESAIGAYLINNSKLNEEYKIYYWREESHEVDFVITKGRTIIAIEVKSGEKKEKFDGLRIFVERFDATGLIVGKDGISIEKFLSSSIEDLLELAEAHK